VASNTLAFQTPHGSVRIPVLHRGGVQVWLTVQHIHKTKPNVSLWVSARPSSAVNRFHTSFWHGLIGSPKLVTRLLHFQETVAVPRPVYLQPTSTLLIQSLLLALWLQLLTLLSWICFLSF
jgi:hypothetical protein